MKTRHKHKQVKVKKARIQVDEKLLPLLEVLWARGITTLYSCQGGTWKVKNRQGKTVTGDLKGYILMRRDSKSMKLVEELIRDKKIWLEFDHNVGHGYRVTIRFRNSDIKKLTRRLNRKR